jgi:prepilin-type N-terminal cleavage/methylation domain-containing protein
MSRTRGFTLVEMMIALGLAGLVVAGAFQLNGAFAQATHRQAQISELQQSLRLTMNIIERNIRSAGVGLNGDLMRMTGCSSGPVDLYPFRFYNSNTFPPAASDATPGDADADPDYFRVMTALPGNYLATADSGTQTTILGNGVDGWRPGDLFVVNTPGNQAISCVREVTAAPIPPLVTHSSPGTYFPCANVPSEAVTGSGSDFTHCGLSVLSPSTTAPVRVYRSETIFRIYPAPAGSHDPPKLAVMTTGINQLTGGSWQVVADNIEDMQIALIMKNGSVCTDVDSPTLCPPNAISAVRVTLTGRTAQSAGSTESWLGGYEDRPATKVTDGYVRRSLTSVIQLRNQ